MKKICVYGDVMLDIWTVCRPTKVSPESPIPICKLLNEIYLPGGAGNVAANLVSGFAAEVVLIGLSGTDDVKLLDALARAGISIGHIISESCWKTIEKRRFVDELGRHIGLRLDTEEGFEFEKTFTDDHIRRMLIAAAESCDVLVVSDYGKGTCCTRSLVEMATTEFLNRGKFIVINGKPEHVQWYNRADVLVFNHEEAIEANRQCGYFTRDMDVKDLASNLFNSMHRLTKVLITMGSNGMLCYDGRKYIEVPAVPVRVADVAGAGDTVVATIAALGKCDKAAMKLAAKNAAEVVSQHGTSLIGWSGS
jgi:D-beta-D-heptose 7-phosphate kinase/D-beta-D-heptose 1-phosphate adenosyltransferase